MPSSNEGGVRDLTLFVILLYNIVHVFFQVQTKQSAITIFDYFDNLLRYLYLAPLCSMRMCPSVTH